MRLALDAGSRHWRRVLLTTRSHHEMNCTATPGPLLLRPDNYTPRSRTPWGGTRLADAWGKRSTNDGAIIGEAWEFSVEPSFPSRSVDGNLPLVEAIRSNPGAWLGASVAKRFDLPHLLVKLLDASDNLSLQVHPHVIAAPGARDSGKHETWWILDAQDGAGIYLGFRPGTDPDDVVERIRQRGDVAELMNFVAVQPGDVFHIRPGTPHAIGRGVTLFEPQAIHPGHRGVTYRCWDWNRLYDAEGNRCEDGSPRELHIQRFLEVTAWERVCSAGFVESCRDTPGRFSVNQLAFEHIDASHWYEVTRVRGTGNASIDTGDRLHAITCVRGSAVVDAGGRSTTVPAGQTLAIPAAADTVEIEAANADLFVVRDTPLRAHRTTRG